MSGHISHGTLRGSKYGVPLATPPGHPPGLLVVGRPAHTPFDADELRHLQDLAERGAQAVVNAQLFAQVSRALQRAEDATEQLKTTEAQLRHSQKPEALEIGRAHV